MTKVIPGKQSAVEADGNVFSCELMIDLMMAPDTKDV